MIYPKPVMTTKELREMGFSDTQLRRASHHYLSYHYIMKSPGGRRFKWDTEAFEKYRKSILR